MIPSRLAAAVVVLLGLPAGVGAFTFGYAKGFSYLSSDPRACINCHVMNEQYDAWLKSGHRHTATCVDCHLPHEGLEKWIAKADHGFRHSAAFTLQNFKEPIEITPKDRELVLENCVRCHAGLVQAIHSAPNPRAEEIGLPALPHRSGSRSRRLTDRPFQEQDMPHASPRSARAWFTLVLSFAALAGVTILLLALLTNIFERKVEEGRRDRGLHRKAQWRLDFVAAENSMGFHAPQELARILAEAIDYARQGQMAARAADPSGAQTR